MAILTALAAGHGWTAGDLSATGHIEMCPAYQKVYFADGRTSANGGYNKLDCVNTRCVGTVGDGPFTQGEIVTQATSGATGIFDENVGTGATAWSLIYRTTTTEFDTTNEITGADSGATLTPTAVVAPPHWTPWTLTDGIFPDGGTNLMGLCFGRIFMNDLAHPHQWLCTRVNDPLDTDTSQTDMAAACSSQTAKAGQVGQELTAFIPYKDFYMLFGCVNSLWVLRSDPMTGGILTNLSRATGVFGSQAWCWDDRNTLYFVGSDGVFGITTKSIQAGEPPINLTKEHLPELVTDMGLNRRTDRVMLSYDKRRYGLTLNAVQADSGWSVNMWIDLRKGGVWPETYQTDHLPHSTMYYDCRKDSERQLLWGGGDGYIRKFSEAHKNDDGSNAISSQVVVGPIVSDGETPREKIEMDDLSVTVGQDTDGITVSIYKAATAEELTDNIQSGVGANLQKTFTSTKLLAAVRQKMADGAIAIKLSNSTASQSWSIEKISANLKGSGRIK